MNLHDPKVVEILDAALELPVPERATFVAQACGQDQVLRQAVEALLAKAAEAELFFDEASPAAGRGSPAVPAEQVGDRIGRYRLLQQIGEGGSGAVYMAEQEVPVRRRVALKIIKLGMDTRSVIARFEAERQALALMDHPNITRVLDAGATQTGRPFFVMELVRGMKITDYCDLNLLSNTERLRLFIQVCQAVQHAHQKGIIHRDLKPSNILVTSHDGVPLPKVIDFGIAKATTDQRLTDKTLFTQYEMLVGTPAYMSPEQAEYNSQDVDTRTDIYSLGILLYELVTGEPPYHSATLMKSGVDALRRTIRETTPVRPSVRLRNLSAENLTRTAEKRRLEPPKLLAAVRGDLDWIILKAIEKDRTRRYETASALAADVERHLQREPVLARPLSSFYTFRRLVERNQVLVGSLSLAVLLLVIGATVSSWQWHRASQAESLQRGLRLQTEQALERAELENYHSAIAVAEKFIEQGQTERALALLLECPEKYRHWEWGRLLMLCHAEFRTFHSRGGAIAELTFSPDGSLLAARSHSGRIMVWQLANGIMVYDFPAGSPSSGSIQWTSHTNELVIVNKENLVSLWNAATGQSRITAGGLPVSYVSVNPLRPQLLTISATNHATVWDLLTGTVSFELEGGAPGSVGEGFFSPDGRQIVAVDKEFKHQAGTRVGRAWDATTGKISTPLRAPNEQWDKDLLWLSRDGRHCASIHSDGTMRVWETATGTRRFSKLGKGVSPLRLAISPDSTVVVAMLDNSTVRLWNIETGDEVPGPTERTYRVQFTSEGRFYVSSGAARVAWVWDSQTGEPFALRGHGAFVGVSVFSADGRLVATAGGDGVVKVWSVHPGRENLGEPFGGRQAAFCPDSKRLATAQGQTNASVWDVDSGQRLLKLGTAEDLAQSVACSVDGTRLATGLVDQRVKIWDAATGQWLQTLPARGGVVQRLVFNPDGRGLATVAGDHTARIWDLRTGRESAALTDHRGKVTDVAFDSEGRRVATVGTDQIGRIWDANTGAKQLELHGHTAPVRCVVFSPDGRRIVTGGDDRTLRFWDLRNGALVRTLTARTRVHSLQFSPDGRRLFTSSTEANAEYGHPSFEVWDALAGRELLSLAERKGVGGSVAFSPDGLRLVSLSSIVRVREAFPWQDGAYAQFPGASLRERVGSYAESYWDKRLALEASVGK